MRIDRGDMVLAADGEELGKVHRVVVDPASKSATHLVVSGGLLTAERVVPIDIVEEEDERTLRLTKDVEVEDLPPFEEQYTVPVSGLERTAGYSEPLAWYYPYGVVGAYPTFVDFGPAAATPVRRNVDEDSAALEIGAAVLSAEGERLGAVEEVVTNPETGRVESFVVSSGLFFKHRTMVPVGWVRSWGEKEIALDVEASTLEELPPYRPVR